MTLLRLLFVVGILVVCCSAALPKQSTALAIIDSKFRHENPLEIEAILFGSDNKHFSGETECHVDVDVMWTTSFSAPVSSHPLVADIRSDGQKELIYSTTSNHVEAIEGLDGSKEPGWPVSIPATSFTYTPMLYDYDEDGVQDILITSEQSEVIFVNDAGIPLDEAVLACPPLKIKKKTFHNYNLLATRGFSFLLHQNFDLPSWGKNFNSRILMGIEENNEQENNNINHRTPKNPTFAGVEGWLTPDGVESLELFLPTESSSQRYLEMLRTGFNPLASMQYIKDSEGLFTELDDSIFLYPRISGPPIIVDLEMDGNDELIVPFQFFGDDPFHANIQIEASIRERNPSVSGLVAFDLQTKRIKYIRPLEITSDPSAIRTTIRSSPTVIDINRDGKYDVIVATNTGHIHALNHRLEPIPGFPLAMDSIQGRPVVEDINGDGSLELIVTDSKGNVACFSLDSKTLIWDAKISGVVTGSPSFGDVDGDGKLDIVLATSAGHLWVLNGKDGTNLNHFPSRLTGNFMGSPLILQMADGDKHMSIIVHSLDGHVYIINGKTGCTETIDVGHKGSQMVIADDLTNNNKLDLIVSSGDSVYALSTDVPYSPQRVWTLPDHGLNVHTSLHWQAIYFDLDHSHSLEISGSSFAVSFVIVDSRSSSAQRTYNVRIYLNRQKVLHEATFFQPGLHTVVLDSPPERLSSLLHISMTNQHLQYYHDAVSVDFNTKFYRSLKWIVVAPLVFATMIVLFMKA